MDFSGMDQESTQTDSAHAQQDPLETVPGRVLHYDADFLAYQNGAYWEEDTLDQSIEKLRLSIQTQRILWGAEEIRLYVTLGTKGGRWEESFVKEYQAQRGSARAPELEQRVHELRSWMSECTDTHVSVEACYDQEADDALTQAMYRAVEAGDENLNILHSLDKDLYMAPGIHANHKTGELEDFSVGVGTCELDTSTATKKVVGKGTSFFWHQLLMGDTADNIPGLPEFAPSIVAELWPNKKLLADREKIRTSKTDKLRRAARIRVRTAEENMKGKKAGHVKVFEYLQGCTTDKEYLDRCIAAYRAHYGNDISPRTKYDGTVEDRSAARMMLEQARLLWMRRHHGEDVFKFFEEVMER